MSRFTGFPVCVHSCLLVPPVSAQRSWARCCGHEQGQHCCPGPFQPQLWLFCCRGACAKPGDAQSGAAELVAPHESLCTLSRRSGSPELGVVRDVQPCQHCRELARPWHSPAARICLGFAKAPLASHTQGCWAGPCSEGKSGTRPGQATGSSAMELVPHRGNGAGESTKPMGLFCIPPNTPSW